MTTEEYQYLLKFVLIGDTNVGKSCFLSQYVRGIFHPDYEPTIGLEFESKSIELNDGIVIQNQLWDTSGSGQFKAIQKTFCQNATVAILFYKINNIDTFKSLNSWIDILKQVSSDMIQIVIVGTHKDLNDERQVNEKDGRQLAENLNAKFYEISNKEKDQIDGIINSLSYNILRLINQKKLNPLKQQYGVKMSRQQEEIITQLFGISNTDEATQSPKGSEIKSGRSSITKQSPEKQKLIDTTNFQLNENNQKKQGIPLITIIIPIILAIALYYYFI